MRVKGVDGALVKCAGAGDRGRRGGVVDEEDDGGDNGEGQEAYSASGGHFDCDRFDKYKEKKKEL